MQKTYQRLCKAFILRDAPNGAPQDEREPIDFNLASLEISRSSDHGEEDSKSPSRTTTLQKMLEFLEDDLNTPGMWGILFEALPSLQKDQKELCLVKKFIQQVLGLTLIPLQEKEVEITPEIEQLIKEREAARAAKNWKKADELREQLRILGYEVKDKKQ